MFFLVMYLLLVVRLTADNVFPDSKFIGEVVAYYVNSGTDYVCANGVNSGLPYGVSMEVMSLGKLREANKNNTSAFDREHVTPFVRRTCGEDYFQAYAGNDFAFLRCTVDSFDDYLRMTSLFSQVSDPIYIPTSELIERLKMENILASEESSKMVIGCVQLGMDYGVNNKVGKPSQTQSHKLLTEAVHSGVIYLDTARAYGESEKIIGNWLKCGWYDRVKIITKLSPLAELSEEVDKQIIDLVVRQSVQTSCNELGVRELDVLMLHRANHLKSHRGIIFKTLLDMQSEKIINKLGVSVQTPEELALVLDYDEISFIQLPFNILDYRWTSVLTKLRQTKADRELTVHVRSVFLQGLLLSDDCETWNKVIPNSTSIRKWLISLCKQYKCKSVGALAIKYVKSQDWVDALVVGAETLEQLRENIKNISIESFDKNDLYFIDKSRPIEVSEQLINPVLW